MAATPAGYVLNSNNNKSDPLANANEGNLDSLHSPQDEDSVLDIDTLKQFTIPKKSKAKKGSFILH
jgi:hypothetical protein